MSLTDLKTVCHLKLLNARTKLKGGFTVLILYNCYFNLERAKEACKRDSNCAAVYDHYCSSNHYYYLCPLGYKEEISTVSCLYIKSAGTLTIKIIKMNILQSYSSISVLSYQS